MHGAECVEVERMVACMDLQLAVERAKEAEQKAKDAEHLSLRNLQLSI